VPKPKKAVKAYTPPKKQELSSEPALPTPEPSPTPAPVVQNSVVEEPEEEESRLTGSWLGYRPKLADHGLDFSYIYKGEVVRNTSGGVESATSLLQNMDIKLDVDGEKLAGWKGSSASFYYLYNFSDSPSENVGDSQVTSNIEAGVTISKLYEAWIQQELLDGGVSILAGLHDLNSEFYVTETSGLFFNSSFGIGKDLSQTGVNGPSIFPTTSPALRLRVNSGKNFYMQTAAFNAQAGDPDEPTGTKFRLDKNDGLLLITEFAYLRGEDNKTQARGKYGFGFWTYTNTFESNSSEAGVKKTDIVNRGYYFLADQELSEMVAVFARYGTASHEVNQFASCLGAGFVFTGLVPLRNSDKLGIAIARVENGKTHRNNMKASGTDFDDGETAYELNYRIELYPGVAIQPDYQYIVDPSSDPEIKDAHVVSARLELSI
jgi:porin